MDAHDEGLKTNLSHSSMDDAAALQLVVLARQGLAEALRVSQENVDLRRRVSELEAIAPREVEQGRLHLTRSMQDFRVESGALEKVSDAAASSRSFVIEVLDQGALGVLVRVSPSAAGVAGERLIPLGPDSLHFERGFVEQWAKTLPLVGTDRVATLAFDLTYDCVSLGVWVESDQPPLAHRSVSLVESVDASVGMSVGELLLAANGMLAEARDHVQRQEA